VDERERESRFSIDAFLSQPRPLDPDHLFRTKKNFEQDDVLADEVLLRFLDLRSIASVEAASRRLRDLVREREVFKRTVLRRYGSGGRGRRRRKNENGDEDENEEEENDEEEQEEPFPAPGEAPRQPVQGLPLSDGASSPRESSLLWKRLGLAFSAGFEKAKREAAAEEAKRRNSSLRFRSSRSSSSSSSTASSSSLSLIADALAASSTDQPEEHVSNLLSPRSHPRRRWEACSYWSSAGSADAASDERLSFRLAHPLCVATALVVRPFAAHFQPGRPVYAPRTVQLASGRSDCWSEEGVVGEWERGGRGGQAAARRRGRGGGGVGGRLLRLLGGRRSSDDDDDDDDDGEGEGGEGEGEIEEGEEGRQQRFITTDARGLSVARTEGVIAERRRAHPRAYPLFDGAFLRDNSGENGGGNGGGGGNGDGEDEGRDDDNDSGSGAWAAATPPMPVRKSGRAQRLSLIDEEGQEESEGEGEGEGGGRASSASYSRQQRQRRRSSGGGGGGGGGGAGLLMTGGHARLVLRGRTQTQRHVDDLFYTCLSYVAVEGFAVRGLRMEFRAAAAEAEKSGGGKGRGGEENDCNGAAAAAAAAAATTTAPNPAPASPASSLVPVLVRIPEGRDPLFDLVPGGLSAVSERGRAGTRAERRRRALETARGLFSLPGEELCERSRAGTRALAEALVAAADDSASDREFGREAEEGEEMEEEDEEEEEEVRRGGEQQQRGDDAADADAAEDAEDEPESGAAEASLVSGFLLPDGGAFPPEPALRMVRMLSAALASRRRGGGGG